MEFQPWKDYLNLKEVLFTSTIFKNNDEQQQQQQQQRCLSKINFTEAKNENCVKEKQILKFVIRKLESNKGEKKENKTNMITFLPKVCFNELKNEKSIKAEPTPKRAIKDKEFNNRKEKENNPNMMSSCTFCRKNGEQKSVYLSHSLKNDKGLVTCPILQKYVCPKCKATGPNSHTLLYCPQNKNYQSPAVVHLTPKMSSGVKRRDFRYN